MAKGGADDSERPSSARRHLPFFLGLLAIFWTAFGDVREGRGAPEDVQQIDTNLDDAEDSETLDYVVVFEGLSENKTKDILTQIAESLKLEDKPATSFSRLRRRAVGDVPRLLQALRARGHYQAKVDLDIDRNSEPITVTYQFDPGPVYDFDDFAIEINPPSEDEIDLPSRSSLDIRRGKRASSIKVIEAETKLLERLKKQGFANVKLGPRTIVVDHNTAEMDVTLSLDPGPKVYFGETTVAGNEEVETRFIRRLFEWKPGKLLTTERLQTTRLNLIETELFSSVRIEPGKVPDDRGRVPVRIEVKEAKHRTIEVGTRFRTDEGFGGSLGWEHRNLLGTGEQLGFELEASQIGGHLRGVAREPDFLRRRQALVIGAEIAIENTDAFDSRSIGSYVGIERSVGKGMELAAGVKLRALKVEQDGDKEDYGLLSLPVRYSWDHSNNLLNPSDGGRLNIENEPFTDVIVNDVTFNKTTVAYRRYLRLKRARPRLILAGRAKAGFIFGAERDNIPADERFYAGGGGSVRGFGFQLAGELDQDDDPIGGRSLLELAGELRSQFNDTIGAALFVDSGTAYRSTVPDFEEDLRVGVGGGLRYFSPIGPIRLDVGVPVNRRDSDDAFQIYVSIGQAF